MTYFHAESSNIHSKLVFLKIITVVRTHDMRSTLPTDFELHNTLLLSLGTVLYNGSLEHLA